MKVLLIEDEAPAAEKLERHLRRYDPGIEVIGRLDSVEKVVAWFRQPQPVDLIFMDIQLTDGLSFDAFSQVSIQKPIIFTTAFNQYALEAFRVNGIDYLLKPITYEALAASMQKLDMLRDTFAPGKTAPWPLEQLGEALRHLQKPTYKTRFMVRLGDHIHSVTADRIALFYAVDRDVFLLTDQKKKYIIDYKLEELDEMLDPAQFFRVNRSFIISIGFIQDVLVYSSSRLLIRPGVAFDREIIVSRERVAPFKEWFNGLR
jgi:two-component system, LytTR family, response regulator